MGDIGTRKFQCLTSGPATTLGLAVLVVLSAALLWAPSAHAQAGTQCSASMTIIPSLSPPTPLQQPPGPNDTVTFQVFISQTCTTNGPPVPAVVTGTTKVDTACATANRLGDASGTGCDIANEQLGSLVVTSCTTAGTPNANGACSFLGSVASITYADSCTPILGSGSNCLTLPFGNLVQVATITAQTVAGQQIVPSPGLFFVTGSIGGSNVNSGSARAAAQGSAPENYPFPSPTFSVAKSCTATFDPATQQVNVSFTATVTNQDITEAINYNCTDSTGALLSNNPGQAPIPPPGTAVLTGSYTQSGISASDTMTCTATGVTSSNPAGTQTANAACAAVTAPSIDVPKVCTMVFNPATQQFDVSFTATLTNTGNETITGITCGDTPNVALIGVPASLAPGASATITGTYSTGSNPASDTITCSGVGATSGTPVSSTRDATCQTVVTPTATLTKACTAAINAAGTGINVSFTATLTNTGPEDLNVTGCLDNPPASLTGVPSTLAHSGGTATITGSYTQTSPSAADTLTCNAAGAASGTGITPAGNTACQVTPQPAISVVKGSASGPNTCVITLNPGTQKFDVTFSFTLTNTGTEALNNVTCSDVPAATLSAVPSTLSPGQAVVITGSYSQAGSTANDTITCNGVGAISGTLVSSNSPATCQTTLTPTATLTKACTAAINAAGTGINVSFTATLTNTGSENLNVTGCLDNPPASLTGVPSTLAHSGGTATITGSYTQTSPSAADTLTCNAAGAVSGTGITPAGNTACQVTPQPAINVVKGSASGPSTCVITFNPGTQQFDVTFSFTLTNTGTEQLNSVTCSDNPVATLSAVPSTLSPGQALVITGSYSQAGSTANDTITCNGAGAISGTTVSSNSPATCQTTVTPTATLTKACTAAINQARTGINVSFTATLTNNGNEDLTNITCSDSPSATLSGVPGSLAHGASVTITGTYSTSANPATDTLTCSGTGVVSGVTSPISAQATCDAPPGQEIPTLSESGMVLMVIFLIGVGFVTLRRRRNTDVAGV